MAACARFFIQSMGFCICLHSLRVMLSGSVQVAAGGQLHSWSYLIARLCSRISNLNLGSSCVGAIADTVNICAQVLYGCVSGPPGLRLGAGFLALPSRGSTRLSHRLCRFAPPPHPPAGTRLYLLHTLAHTWCCFWGLQLLQSSLWAHTYLQLNFSW